MGFLSELLFEAIKFIFLVIVAGVGVFAGIMLRKIKNKKLAPETNSTVEADKISEE